MLDPNLLRTEPDAVAEKLARRGFKLDVDKLRALEERRKVLQVQTENLQAERNSRSKSIGQAKARGEDIEPLRLEVNKLGEQLDAAKSELETLLAEIRDIALAIPNIPQDGKIIAFLIQLHIGIPQPHQIGDDAADQGNPGDQMKRRRIRRVLVFHHFLPFTRLGAALIPFFASRGR